MPACSRLVVPVLVVACLGAIPVLATNSLNPRNANVKEIAGTAQFLRSVPKHFATLKAMDVAHHRVTLLLDGETLPKVWTLVPHAEVKVAGWWGRLDQF